MKMTLADGTILDNLELNANTYVSQEELTEDTFDGNLSTVTVEDSENVQEYSNCVLEHVRQDGDVWKFVLREMTATEIKENVTDAQVLYTALMTDTLLEEE